MTSKEVSNQPVDSAVKVEQAATRDQYEQARRQGKLPVEPTELTGESIRLAQIVKEIQRTES